MKILLPVLLLLALPACRQVPLDKVTPEGGDEQEYRASIARADAAFARQPRSVESVQQSAQEFAAAFRVRADEYDDLCRAARACAWLGEYMESRTERRPIVRQGLSFANTALSLREGTDARYLRGVLAGMLGDVDHDFGLDAARTVEADMKLLVESGAQIANAGPQRVLGALYLRAPGPPTSVGSMRNARRMLTAAVQAAPDWPENHLYMAELELAGDQAGNPGSARTRLEQHLLGASAKAPDGWEYEFRVWQQRARDLLESAK